MWHKAGTMEHPVRIELTNNGLLIQFATHVKFSLLDMNLLFFICYIYVAYMFLNSNLNFFE